MKVVFLPWDDRLATLHLLYHVWGPILGGYPTDNTAVWALYFAAPNLVPTDADLLKDVVQKLTLRKHLTDEEKRLVDSTLVLKPPKILRDRAIMVYKKLKRQFKGISKDVREVVSKVHGKEVLKEEIRVFPSFQLTGAGGSAYKNEVGISPDVSFGYSAEERNNNLLRVLVHELVHIYVERDEIFDNLLKEISRKHNIPFHEVHVETLTNIIWWKTGNAKKMFHMHYDKNWKRLVRVEKQYWKVFRDWWKGGGDLAKMVRSTFLQKASLESAQL